MTDSPTTTRSDLRPRVLHTAAGVVAQYIHELSERHAEAARTSAAAVPGPRPGQVGADC